MDAARERWMGELESNRPKWSITDVDDLYSWRSLDVMQGKEEMGLGMRWVLNRAEWI